MTQYSRAAFLKAAVGKPAKTAKPTSPFANKQLPGRPRSSTGLNAYSGTWGQAQIMHLLRRSLFGVAPADYNHFQSMTLTQCLDALLIASTAPSPPINTYNTATYTDPDIPALQTWVNAPQDQVGTANNKRQQNFKEWWVGQLVNQDRSLTEKMTFFWHNHFATQTYVYGDARYAYKHYSLLRTNALGNFKSLTREVTTDLAMLDYLNGNSNTKNAPNENYGRELQELFTVGKGPNSHYTEDDVKAAARVLTGWKDDKATMTMAFNSSKHDTTDKQFSSFYNSTVITGQSGANGATETDQLIDMIFAQQETAMFISRKLYRFFVYYVIDSQVESDIITPMANLLMANSFEILPVLRALLGSEHFFDSINIGCHIKNPLDHIIGFCRQFGMQFDTVDPINKYNQWGLLWQAMVVMGVDLGDPPNVAGWPAYYQEPQYHELWINSDTLPYRNQYTDVFSTPDGLVYQNIVLKVDWLAFTASLSNPGDPNQLLADVAAMMSANDYGTTQLATAKSVLLSGQLQDHYWTDAWNQYIGDPTNATYKNTVQMRLTYCYSYLLERAEYQLI